ncbi:MAG: hypothetical protein Q8882_06810 [Bacillota bacterium]|nr:hypothetical protein [Bacillota bacterium]
MVTATAYAISTLLICLAIWVLISEVSVKPKCDIIICYKDSKEVYSIIKAAKKAGAGNVYIIAENPNDADLNAIKKHFKINTITEVESFGERET